MKKIIPSVLAASVGIVSIFAFSPAPASNAAKTTQTRWTIDNNHTPPCVSTLCTNTVKTTFCGLNNIVYKEATCSNVEGQFIYKP